jgi:hypothetical protein
MYDEAMIALLTGRGCCQSVCAMLGGWHGTIFTGGVETLAELLAAVWGGGRAACSAEYITV